MGPSSGLITMHCGDDFVELLKLASKAFPPTHSTRIRWQIPLHKLFASSSGNEVRKSGCLKLSTFSKSVWHLLANGGLKMTPNRHFIATCGRPEVAVDVISSQDVNLRTILHRFVAVYFLPQTDRQTLARNRPNNKIKRCDMQ